MPSRADILPIDTPARFETAINAAVEALRDGKVVVLPTETVYGLAANALDARAIARIYEVKERPRHNPIIVHVAESAQARACTLAWPKVADQLAEAFWPGPLTLVLPRAGHIPDIVVAGGPTVGIRWPSHPFMQAVIRRAGFPLAAPSANPANQLSPTTAAHVETWLGDRVPLIIDGGPCGVGIESTVVDLSGPGAPCILRPGTIHAASLEAVAGALREREAGFGLLLRSPGQLPRHYAPRATLRLLPSQDILNLRTWAAQHGLNPTRIHVLCYDRIPGDWPAECVSVIPHDPQAYARALYAELHACDDRGAEMILVETPPTTSPWDGVRDRLFRAAQPDP